MNKVYTDNGMWLEQLDNGNIRIGISPYGQDEVGEIVFYDPIETEQVEEGEAFAAIEGAKAVTEIASPITGTIIKSNERLLDNPHDLNEEDNDKNWFIIVSVDNFEPSSFRQEDMLIEEE